MLKRKASSGALTSSPQRPLKHTAQPSASQHSNGLAEGDTLDLLTAKARIIELERMLAESELAREEAEERCRKFKYVDLLPSPLARCLMLMIPSCRLQLHSIAQKAALRREAKVRAAAAAARRSDRIEWQLEHMNHQWDVPEINSKLGVNFAHHEHEEAFEWLRKYIEDGKLSRNMDDEFYAHWRHEYELKRKEEMGDAYVFERTDTDDGHDYEPENDGDDDADDC
jgi:hypothetical protein